MNSTPPIARLRTSLVFGAVWPMNWPTRSSRVTATRWPLRDVAEPLSISAIRMRDGRLAGPGLPVKHMCSVGRAGGQPEPLAAAGRSSSSAAISRMRALTGASADQLAIELLEHRDSPSLRHRLDVRRSALGGQRLGSGVTPFAVAPPAGPRAPAGPTRHVEAGRSCRSVIVAAVTLPGGPVGRVRMQRVPDLRGRAAVLALEPEAGLVGGPVDDEAQRRGLAARATRRRR